MARSAFLGWGWRLPFFASAVSLVLGLLIRAGFDESRELSELKAQ